MICPELVCPYIEMSQKPLSILQIASARDNSEHQTRSPDTVNLDKQPTAINVRGMKNMGFSITEFIKDYQF